MASLLDRFRAWLGVNSEHTAEHVDIWHELTEQQTRLRALDAYVEARSSRRDRRRIFTASHPQRRIGDQ